VTQVNKAIQSLVIASAELRYLALEYPACEIEYRAIAEALAVIAAEVGASDAKTSAGNIENKASVTTQLGNLHIL
jgi:hypothetical protein